MTRNIEPGRDAVGEEPDGAGYPHTKVTREDWVRAALDTLISDGVQQVKILTLASTLDVSRSSFYWYFESRDDLLSALLEIWRETNTKIILEQARKPSANIGQAVLNLFSCWIDEKMFDPRLDFAVREWSRRSGRIRRVVDMSDDERVDAIRDMFLRHGYEATDAFVRARVLYFMQIGYYALELNESVETRAGYTAAYLRSFTGVEPEEEDISAFLDKVRPTR